MPSFRQYPHILLVVLLVFCQILYAANFAEEHDPEGALRVRLDYELATRSTKDWEGGHQWVFSSHITFNEDVGDITDGQLRKMAEDAFQEMEANIMLYEPKWDKKLGRPKMQPGVITILALRNEVFLSSSQKGTVAFINEVVNSPVKDQLELCQALWQDFNINPDKPDHKNGRKCGEMMAFHQYYLEHEEPLQDLDPLARVTTVARVKDRETGESNLRIIPPCGTDEHHIWGCSLFLLNPDGPGHVARYLPDDTALEDYVLDNLAGGVEDIGQIRACAGLPDEDDAEEEEGS